MNSSAPIRVLIVDDHPVVRRGLIFAFQTLGDLELVGEAESGSAALDLCGRLRPDVVLMDLMMPGISAPVSGCTSADAGGVAAIRAIRQRFPHIRVLVLTSFVTKELIQAALGAGACGYLLKDTSLEDLAQAIRMTSVGHATLAAAVAQALVESPAAPPDALADLTARQREVLTLVADGLTNQQIANELVISHATARSHVSCILAALGVANRAEAAAVATKYDLLKAPASQPVQHAALAY